LLAGLFLYNPFLAASAASGGLTVRHPVSYRATVASCEVEQFAQPNSGATALLPNVEDARVLILQLTVIRSTPRHYLQEQEEVAATPQTGFSSSLWFRPPPAV
jgi:hypothetical protein